MGRQHHLTDALNMSDKERAMMTILSSISPFTPDSRFGKGPQGWGTYWAEPEVGDLVKCQSQRTTNRWNWAWLVEERTGAYGERIWLLRELGGEGLCDMSNESLIALRGVSDSPYMLEGEQFRFWVKVSKAFRHIDKWDAMLRGVKWPDRHSRVATIGLRPTMFRHPRGPFLPGTDDKKLDSSKRFVAKPVIFAIPHTPKTTIRSIVAAVQKHTPASDAWEFEIAKGGGGAMDLPFEAIAVPR